MPLSWSSPEWGAGYIGFGRLGCRAGACSLGNSVAAWAAWVSYKNKYIQEGIEGALKAFGRRRKLKNYDGVERDFYCWGQRE